MVIIAKKVEEKYNICTLIRNGRRMGRWLDVLWKVDRHLKNRATEWSLCNVMNCIVHKVILEGGNIVGDAGAQELYKC